MRRSRSRRQLQEFGFTIDFVVPASGNGTGEGHQRFTRRSDYRDDGYRRATDLPPCPGRGGRCGKTVAHGIEHLTCPRCGAVREEAATA